MVGRRRVASSPNPDAVETTCDECGATIEVTDEKVMDAVIQHFKAEHGLGE